MNTDIILKEFLHLPRFDDGRINYSDTQKAPVLTCFVKVNDEFLLLKRSSDVRAYKEKWDAVCGYIDQNKPLKELALLELEEEVGVFEAHIKHIAYGEPYTHTDVNGFAWIIYPLLVELFEKPDIRLDWEHTEFVWIKRDGFLAYDTVPNLYEELASLLDA